MRKTHDLCALLMIRLHGDGQGYRCRCWMIRISHHGPSVTFCFFFIILLSRCSTTRSMDAWKHQQDQNGSAYDSHQYEWWCIVLLAAVLWLLIATGGSASLLQDAPGGKSRVLTHQRTFRMSRPCVLFMMKTPWRRPNIWRISALHNMFAWNTAISSGPACFCWYQQPAATSEEKIHSSHHCHESVECFAKTKAAITTTKVFLSSDQWHCCRHSPGSSLIAKGSNVCEYEQSAACNGRKGSQRMPTRRKELCLVAGSFLLVMIYGQDAHFDEYYRPCNHTCHHYSQVCSYNSAEYESSHKPQHFKLPWPRIHYHTIDTTAFAGYIVATRFAKCFKQTTSLPNSSRRMTL